MSIIFVCKICKTKHASTEAFENGVAKLPDSITTLKDTKSN
jgi:predicted metal-binding protein